jgi:outer membrane receptor protein involved in Fe transport
MFSADELLNDGNSFVSYYGYDYTGEKLSSRPTLDDFFNQSKTVDGYNGPTVYQRNIGAYEPNYVAGYIQDKFAFKDLIFNIGLRIDRFDANQQKLKDPYLLFPAILAGEVRAGGDRGNLNQEVPSNIGDEYVVYVDNIGNPSEVVGYRDGDTWYNNVGAELPNSSTLLTSTGIQPYLVDPDKTEASEISSKAFEDYEPQTTFMPRIAFSFPISDEAMFFAHYDVLSRRPEGATRFNPTQYLFMQTNPSALINNPNLKPSSTVDYELGFQQKLNNFSSLKISAFYKEERDMVQVTKVVDAFPITYTTFANLDFSTIKGMTVAYDLRRMGNARLRASYTLQFADGTGSSTQQALAVISAGFPNLKTINPLNWDQRHAISTSFDYRYGKGKDYDGPVINFKGKNIKILEEAGANVLIIGGSGVPYSKQRNITKEGGFASESAILDGTLNGSRLPWQINMDAKVDKYFDLEWGRENKKRASLNVYLQVLNVLNTLNITNVYAATGNPDNDGYLNDPNSQSGIVQLNSEQSFRELYALKVNNPGNYSLPRRIRLGLMVNF